MIYPTCQYHSWNKGPHPKDIKLQAAKHTHTNTHTCTDPGLMYYAWIWFNCVDPICITSLSLIKYAHLYCSPLTLAVGRLVLVHVCVSIHDVQVNKCFIAGTYTRRLCTYSMSAEICICLSAFMCMCVCRWAMAGPVRFLIGPVIGANACHLCNGVGTTCIVVNLSINVAILLHATNWTMEVTFKNIIAYKNKITFNSQIHQSYSWLPWWLTATPAFSELCQLRIVLCHY